MPQPQQRPEAAASKAYHSYTELRTAAVKCLFESIRRHSSHTNDGLGFVSVTLVMLLLVPLLLQLLLPCSHCCLSFCPSGSSTAAAPPSAAAVVAAAGLAAVAAAAAAAAAAREQNSTASQNPWFHTCAAPYKHS